jgi:glyoxylase-like metal-dependent hydrolase (beta-lactamase superfamily II)
MKIHHLNCATICGRGGRYIGGQGGPLAKVDFVCHCLLIETAQGLVLVDTGFGLEDCARPRERLGIAVGTGLMAPRLDPEETAARRVERLGFRREDVRHIVVTHLDLDHAGGISDFPAASVHVFGLEQDAALAPATLHERFRYRPAHWAHGPRWIRHAVSAGEPWFGFECARALEGLPPEILLVPLLGHTRGHCGVAVDAGAEGWWLHAGDAYFHHLEVEGKSAPIGLELFQRHLATDDRARKHNQARLAELARAQTGRVRVFCAHDPSEFDRYR